MTRTRPSKSKRKKPAQPEFFVPSVRRDAKIKGFDLERQRKIIGWWTAKGEVHARKMIKKEWGITVSCQTFYEALAFWRSASKWSQVEAQARVQVDQEAAMKGSMSPEERNAALERNFLTLAAADGDTDLFLEFRKLDLKRQEVNSKQAEVSAKLKQREKELDRKERELALSIQKFQFDGAKAALKHLSTLRSIAADRSLNSDEKIEAVRLKLWGTAPVEEAK